MADYIDRDAAVEAAFEADSLELATHGANRIADRIRYLPAIDPAAIREAALREAEKALRDWQDALNANRFLETAITVGVAADAILALIDQPAPDHSAAPGNMIDNPSNPGG